MVDFVHAIFDYGREMCVMVMIDMQPPEIRCIGTMDLVLACFSYGETGSIFSQNMFMDHFCRPHFWKKKTFMEVCETTFLFHYFNGNHLPIDFSEVWIFEILNALGQPQAPGLGSE